VNYVHTKLLMRTDIPPELLSARMST
jgi:hypothetical protein